MFAGGISPINLEGLRETRLPLGKAWLKQPSPVINLVRNRSTTYHLAYHRWRDRIPRVPSYMLLTRKRVKLWKPMEKPPRPGRLPSETEPSLRPCAAACVCTCSFRLLTVGSWPVGGLLCWGLLSTLVPKEGVRAGYPRPEQ